MASLWIRNGAWAVRVGGLEREGACTRREVVVMDVVEDAHFASDGGENELEVR